MRASIQTKTRKRDLKPLSVRLNATQMRRLRVLAAHLGVSKAAYAEKAINRAVERDLASRQELASLMSTEHAA